MRTGPEYKRLGLKAPSKPALYELITMDLVRLNGKLTLTPTVTLTVTLP